MASLLQFWLVTDHGVGVVVMVMVVIGVTVLHSNVLSVHPVMLNYKFGMECLFIT